MDSERLVACLRALADPNRLAIFELLCQEQQCNCDMGDKLGLAPNLVSHHLRVLRECGLVVAERHATDARWILYSLNGEAVAGLAERIAALLCVDTLATAEPASCGSRCPAMAVEEGCACK